MLKEMKKGEAYLDTYIEINQIYNVLVHTGLMQKADS